MLKEKRKVTVLILYALVFYAIWTGFEFFLSHQISLLHNNLLAEIIKTVIKNLVWTIPAMLLIGQFNGDVLISLKEMFSTKVNWLKYLPIFVVFTIYILIGGYITHGKLAVSPSLDYSVFISLLFVGLTEELVFRGWLLNSSIKGCSDKQKWLMIIINAFMFLLIHFPIWIYQGVLIENFANLGFLSILVLSVVFSKTFIKSRSILVPISLHMYWDLLMFIFV